MASCEFMDFCRRGKIEFETSLAENPQLNGGSEANIKIVKTILRKCALAGKDREEALFNLLCAPREVGNLNPVRLFYNRERGIPELPKISDSLYERTAGMTINKRKQAAKEQAASDTERFYTSPLELKVGMNVVLRGAQ